MDIFAVSDVVSFGCGLLSQARIFNYQWALNLTALSHAGSAHIMTVAVTSLDKSVAAMRALVRFFLPMRLLVVDHIAQFRRLNVTFKAAEELIGTTCCLVNHIVLFKSHVTRIGTVPIADTLLDRLISRLRHSP